MFAISDVDNEDGGNCEEDQFCEENPQASCITICIVAEDISGDVSVWNWFVGNLLRHTVVESLATVSLWTDITQPVNPWRECSCVTKSTTREHEQQDHEGICLLCHFLTVGEDTAEVPLSRHHKIEKKSVENKENEVVPALIDREAPEDKQDESDWVSQLENQMTCESSQEVGCWSIHLVGMLSLEDWYFQRHLEDDRVATTETDVVGQ